jgi:hypothetical protein
LCETLRVSQQSSRNAFPRERMSVAVHEPDHAHTGEDGAERREHDPEHVGLAAGQGLAAGERPTTSAAIESG